MPPQQTQAWEVSLDGVEARAVIAADWWSALGQVLRDSGRLDRLARVVARVLPSGVVVQIDGESWTVRPHAGIGTDGGADVAAACQRALTAALERVPCESGAVLLAEGRFLRFVVASGPHGESLRGVRIQSTTGVAGHVVQTQRSAVVHDAELHPRHHAAIDELTGYKSRHILAVPLAHGGVALGVLELINPTDGGRFSAGVVRHVEQIAQVLGAWLARRAVAT
ncbi:MAG: GAF domain-containing protein [Alphaproteobacteria bacterium]|nr:GAF domain-containing protein [Alphaproteobacteria bacterium]